MSELATSRLKSNVETQGNLAFGALLYCCVGGDGSLPSGKSCLAQLFTLADAHLRTWEGSGMNRRSLMALGATVLLCGCQTSNQADYMQIGYGPSFEVAHAQCEMQKRSADQGYLAIGSPAFVAGAGLGNALGNAVAEDQYMKNCLILNGWKRAPHGQGAAAVAAVATGAPPTHYGIQRAPGSWLNTALLDWSAANNKCIAGDKAACATRARLGAQLRAAGVSPAPV
ncbi:hypothetical protein FJ936_20990 [Mesorhizobium sp. B2-4-13]|uniref:hypothetical protein n=1 Tax=Mesorhizobium sp. B2-4-13 TaxID=2589936 RepID=UPI001151E4D4|nr:hypothetical protein [Mesorhizobium sp. B2-4-13]TPK83414.1 hypothetical protein FJ936_20990 [Mesorhizobium sp. B2-4-13]